MNYIFCEISNYGGRRVKTDNGTHFSLIGVKSEVTDGDFDFVKITVFFNEMINSKSVKAENIFVNGKNILSDTDFSFSKGGRSFSFSVKKPFGDFSILFSGFESFDGQKIKPIMLKDIGNDTFYKYSRDSNTWQKS